MSLWRGRRRRQDIPNGVTPPTPPDTGGAREGNGETTTECEETQRQIAALQRLRRVENRLRALQAELDVLRGG